MRYIQNYRIFENKTLIKSTEEQKTEYLMGKLLHLYGSIPLSKQKSSIVIKKILQDNYKVLGEDIDLQYNKDHDKIRFIDYFDSLLKAKETRGHNFEGFISGIYNGELSKPGERWDVEINKQNWSVKFVDNPSKAPEIGSFRQSLLLANKQEDVIREGGIAKLFQGSNNTLKEEIWEVISKDITGGWLIAYPKNKNNEDFIEVNLIYPDIMKNILMSGGTVAPKGGFKSIFSLALSAKYKNYSNKYKIILPKISLEELKNIYIDWSEDLWSYKVFGEMHDKIRPDVLRYIKDNQEIIGKKLLKYKEF